MEMTLTRIPWSLARESWALRAKETSDPVAIMASSGSVTSDIAYAPLASPLAGLPKSLPITGRFCLVRISATGPFLVKAVFQAATEAARALTTMRQFEAGEQPSARWFPKSEVWPELVNMQKERDAATGADFHSLPQIAPQTAVPRSERPTLVDSIAAFKETDDPVAKARLVLQNPDFLEMALKQDPNAVRDLASLCDTLSQTLYMELEEKSRTESVAHRTPEQQTAPAPRMRA